MSFKNREKQANLDKIFSIIYQDGSFTQVGVDLCDECGIHPKSLLPKTEKDFDDEEQSKELNVMAYKHYEERRILKLQMINDLYQHIKQIRGIKVEDVLKDKNRNPIYDHKSGRFASVSVQKKQKVVNKATFLLNQPAKPDSSKQK